MIAPDADASRVRIADPADEEALFAMCKLLHAENLAQDPLGKRIVFDEEKVRRTLHRALHPTRDNQGTYAGYQHPAWIGVVGAPGALEGSIYLSVEAPSPFSSHLMLVQLWCFVLPEFRASTNLKDMIAFSRQFSDSSKITPLYASVNSFGAEAAKARQYRKQLGEPTGSVFVYEGTA